MIRRHGWKRWLLALAVLHGIITCAGFFAPYDPAAQDRERPYLPPMKIHLVDAHGHFRLRPFFYALHLREGSFDQFEESTDQAIPLRFFVTGARYRLSGFLPSGMHLFGAQAGRIYLLGAMLTAATSSREFSTAGKSRCWPACWGRDSRCSSAC